VGGISQSVPKVQFAHDGPVLDTAFSSDGAYVLSASCDRTAKMWSLAQAGAPGQQIAQHDAPIKSIFCIAEMNLVVTGSWDKTVKFWDCRQATPAGQFQLPERCYAMDVKHPLMVVATAERQVIIYNLSGQPSEFRRQESPLKYQSRCVSCFPDKTGFALGSIEGRVAIHHVDPKMSSKNFAFKCHRETEGSTTLIHAVNALSFHPVLGTFATAGADGIFNFWDKDAKQRLKAFAKCPQAISTACFNQTGDIFAYAQSYDWSKGAQHHNPQNPNNILLHNTTDDEIRPRNKKN